MPYYFLLRHINLPFLICIRGLFVAKCLIGRPWGFRKRWSAMLLFDELVRFEL